MSKVQMITRINGTVVFLVYIPKDYIEASGFCKGDKVVFDSSPGVIKVIKE